MVWVMARQVATTAEFGVIFFVSVQVPVDAGLWVHRPLLELPLPER